MLPEITKCYMEPHRYYHTLRHITFMFEAAKALKQPLTDEQVWAIWLHDLVYEPGADNNEERSAVGGVGLLRTFRVRNYLSQLERVAWHHVIKQIILDTKDHVATTEESKLVIDLDLFLFAQAWTSYIEDIRNIRLEFSKIPDDQFRQGRIHFLNEMLKRKPFYLTKAFRGFENNARHNIRQELLTLEEGALL